MKEIRLNDNAIFDSSSAAANRHGRLRRTRSRAM